MHYFGLRKLEMGTLIIEDRSTRGVRTRPG